MIPETSSVSVSCEYQLSKIMEEFWDDRCGFVKHIIGVEPTAQQVKIYQDLDKYDHVVVKGGHGTGKSKLGADSITHYMCCRPNPKIICSAPTKHQLHDILWSELSASHNSMASYLASEFTWQKEKFFNNEHSETWFAAARTATKEKPEALQGFHAKYVMRVLEEWSAGPDECYEVLQGATGTVETKELMYGNPTRLSGEFYKVFTDPKLKGLYARHTMSCLDSPIAPKAYIERILRRYGEDSNMYRIRVLGEFPLRDGDSYIPFDLVYDAINNDRHVIVDKDTPKVFGCDIARFGDDYTVIAIRQGDVFHPYHVLKNKSNTQVARYIADLANKEKPVAIFIDTIGVGGGVYDILSDAGFPVYGVNVCENPAQKSNEFHRLRDELWGLMREWLEMRRGKLWDNEDNELLGELTTPRYKFTSKNLILIESKDDMKKRGKASPNVADAHNMTFAQPIASYKKDEDMPVDNRFKQNQFEIIDPVAGY